MKVLNLSTVLALAWTTTATLSSPAVPAVSVLPQNPIHRGFAGPDVSFESDWQWAPASTVHLIPQGPSTTSTQYIDQNGKLASGLLVPVPVTGPITTTPTNFTVLTLPVPAGVVGWFSLKSPAGSCTVKGNTYGGQLVCGDTTATGLAPNQFTVFQGVSRFLRKSPFLERHYSALTVLGHG